MDEYQSHCMLLELSMSCKQTSKLSLKSATARVICRCSGVNFENSNFNVGLPVFTIHGNHDDPAGADNLSAVDVLSTCNLVNYFGKAVSPLQPCKYCVCRLCQQRKLITRRPYGRSAPDWVLIIMNPA